mmetsp:Transcript_91688/g.286920  ORF Transcript_91688/g.286920 Transcript_91688/m.286920 type:complete len:85 (-) Transcript_91688:169-423(-)
MVLGVPLRQYIFSACCSFGSMALGSVCMHAYMKPELHLSSAEFEEEATARRRAIEEVQRLALDDRFPPRHPGAQNAWQMQRQQQ